MLISVIAQGFLWSILSLGIFMTYRILNFPDMTTEGSFPLGGAISVVVILNGYSPILACLMGFLGGMCAGFVTGVLYTKGKIPVILSGILTMSALHSVMLFLMQSPNLSLLNQRKIQDYLSFLSLPRYFDILIIACVAALCIAGLLYYFFHTDLGQSYIATGDNEMMAKAMGIKTNRMKILGLVLSNGVIALSGALVTQNDGYADINKGIGIIVIGLSAIIIGEILFGELSLLGRLLATICGSILYQVFILIILKLGFNTTYLKFVSSAMLAIFLVLPQIKKRILGDKA